MKWIYLVFVIIASFNSSNAFSSDFELPIAYETDSKLVTYPAKTGFVVGAVVGGVVGIPLSIYAGLKALYPFKRMANSVAGTFVSSVAVGGIIFSGIVGAPFWLVDQACCAEEIDSNEPQTGI